MRGALVVSCLSFAVIGCLAQPQAQNGLSQRSLAAGLNTQPANPTGQLSPHEIPPGGRAADYLAMGIGYFNASQKPEAIRAFTMALDTGNLNDQGRAVAYWHIFLGERDMSRSGPSAEALASFVTVAQLVLNEDLADPEQADDVERFVEGFDLNERLYLAEVMLEAIWAQRDLSYGRSPEHPVRLGTSQGQRMFVQLFGPCAGPSQTSKPEVEIIKAAKNSHRPIDHAVISCPGEAKPQHLFFSLQ